MSITEEKTKAEQAEEKDQPTATQEPQEEASNPQILLSKEDLDEIQSTIRNHVYTSMTVGLVPVPLFDLLALVAVQVNLIRKIAAKYQAPLMQEKIKTTVTTLISAILPQTAAPSLSSLSKFIPVVGHSVSAVTMPILAGASTYATGVVFQKHFASGGTMLNFDMERMTEIYKEAFEKGKSVANLLKKKGKKADQTDAAPEAAPAPTEEATTPASGEEKPAKKSSKSK